MKFFTRRYDGLRKRVKKSKKNQCFLNTWWYGKNLDFTILAQHKQYINQNYPTFYIENPYYSPNLIDYVHLFYFCFCFVFSSVIKSPSIKMTEMYWTSGVQRKLLTWCRKYVYWKVFIRLRRTINIDPVKANEVINIPGFITSN